MKTILFIFGTRPEAIKMAPLILKLKAHVKHQIIVCSTGQHKEMLKPLLHFFKIQPDFDLNLMQPGQTLAALTARLICGLQSIIDHQLLLSRPIDQIIVQGDTTTSFIGGLVAFYNKIQLIHLEAGLRSHHPKSPHPEEFNRKSLTLISDLHLAPTELAQKNLLSEGVPLESVFVTGNTGIDSLFQVKNKIENDSQILVQLKNQFPFLDPTKKLILVTLHRRESFDKNLGLVFQSLIKLAQRKDLQFIIPLHLNPQVRSLAQEYFRENVENIYLTEPQDYIPFVYLMIKSYLIITDSGGIQEEAPSLGKPVLIARENTERPEAITAGTSKLIPLSVDGFLSTVNELIDNPNAYQQMAQAKNPFGDGKACDRIVEILS